MEIEEILEKLKYFDGNYPGEAMEEAVRIRDEIIPCLLESLEDAAEKAR